MALNYRNHHTPIALVLEAKLCYGHAANHLSHFLAVSAIMADERHFSVVSECALAVFIGGYFRGILLGYSPVHPPPEGERTCTRLAGDTGTLALCTHICTVKQSPDQP
jgi:hypothetical protein